MRLSAPVQRASSCQQGVTGPYVRIVNAGPWGCMLQLVALLLCQLLANNKLVVMILPKPMHALAAGMHKVPRLNINFSQSY